MKWMKAKIKGKKSTIDRLKQVSPLLKNRPKHVFLVPKVPKERCVIFCPPPFLPTFLRDKKWFRLLPVADRPRKSLKQKNRSISGVAPLANH